MPKMNKLANHGSSQANESFNNTVVSKQPKSRSYASSGSFSFRVGAAVAQQTIGYTYVSKVCTEAGLSPSRHAEMLGRKMDGKRKRESLRKSSKPVKRRRLELSQLRSSKQSAVEVREGPQYGSECALRPSDDHVLPPPSGPVSCKPLETSKDTNLVFFDLETTGFGNCAEIVQLAAQSGSNTFSQYVVPEKSIHPKATEKIGLTVTVVNGQGRLQRVGSKEPLQSVTLHDAITTSSVG
ncbi:uncharacterized protein LOC135829628 [Sycon ciliatum]|uniref:uncharacterized protein LOC135829628 n=1 Tax=Sycon ciliatum TaxID=27933 RepID=UPI0031F6E7F5